MSTYYRKRLWTKMVSNAALDLLGLPRTVVNVSPVVRKVVAKCLGTLLTLSLVNIVVNLRVII